MNNKPSQRGSDLNLDNFNIGPENYKNPWWVKLAMHVTIWGNLLELFINKNIFDLIFVCLLIYIGYKIDKDKIKISKFLGNMIMIFAVLNIYLMIKYMQIIIATFF